MDGFDRFYERSCFTFTAVLPDGSRLQAAAGLPAAQCARSRDINYLAKDYGSFRQLILDRLAQTLPQWHETHVPDIGIMLVELLAYAGDYLSYYQDAVATEAYLGTARQRISVRRHARLVDYRMHEGIECARLGNDSHRRRRAARSAEHLLHDAALRHA